MEMKSVALPDNELKRLFDRFSLPMTKPCITAKQKQNAIEIAKILWLRLVTGTDTEECVYQDLKRIIGDKHDDIIALGSMYFFRIKAALTDDELSRLKSHYSDDYNFSRLQEWEP